MADDIQELTSLFRKNLEKMDELIEAQNPDPGISSPSMRRGPSRRMSSRMGGRGMEGGTGRSSQPIGRPGGDLGVGMAGVSNIMKQQQQRQEQEKEQSDKFFNPFIEEMRSENQPMKINNIDDSSFDSLIMQMRATTWRVRLANPRKNIIEPFYYSLQTLQYEMMDFFEKEHKAQAVIQRNQLKFLEDISPNIKKSLDESIMVWMDRFQKAPFLTSIKTLAAGVMSVVKPLSSGIMTLLFGQKKKQRTTVQAIDQQTAFLRTGLIKPMGRFSGLITGSLTKLPKMFAQRTEDKQARGEGTGFFGRMMRDQFKDAIVLQDQRKKEQKSEPFEGANKIPQLLEGILTNSKFIPFVWETNQLINGKVSFLNQQIYSLQMATFYMMKSNLESMSYYAEVGYNNERRDQNLQDLEQQASADRERKMVELQKETVGAINDIPEDEEQTQQAQGGFLSRAGVAKALRGGAIVALTGAVGMIGKSVYDALTNPGGENLIHDLASQLMGRELISKVVGETIDHLITSIPGSQFFAPGASKRTGGDPSKTQGTMDLVKSVNPGFALASNVYDDVFGGGSSKSKEKNKSSNKNQEPVMTSPSTGSFSFRNQDEDSSIDNSANNIESNEKQRKKEDKEQNEEQKRINLENHDKLTRELRKNNEKQDQVKQALDEAKKFLGIISKNTEESNKQQPSYSPVTDNDTVNNNGGLW